MPGEGRNLLVVGHPGHELRAYGWIADTRPRVCILTDGGGSSANASRLSESVSLLSGLGAQIGPICGAWSDRSLYEIILAGECASLVRSAEQLAEVMIDVPIAPASPLVVAERPEEVMRAPRPVSRGRSPAFGDTLTPLAPLAPLQSRRPLHQRRRTRDRPRRARRRRVQ